MACEGEVTEPQYLEGFRRWCRNPLVHVEIARERGVPRTVVEIALRKKQDAEKAAKREGDDNLLFDEVWAVYDVDEHPPHIMNDARQIAGANEIDVAVSNPCFELWLVLHFRESPGQQHRHRVQDMVRDYVRGYEKALDFEAVHAGYHQAVRRATKLDESAERDDEAGRNPTTGVYRLTESIRVL